MGDDRVKFICKRTVVSTKPVEPGKSYRFSVFDRVMEPNHIRLVFYYKCPNAKKPGETTKKLRESLAEALTCFPMITGRLVKDEGERGWKVRCNDAGVRMIEARASGTVEEWLGNVDTEEELRLVHWEEIYHGSSSYFWSTFYVQITEFEGGGFAIGLSSSHLLADPICATTLLGAWAEATLAPTTMAASPLVHQLPSCRPRNEKADPKPYDNHLLKHYINSCSSQPSSFNPTNNDFTTVTLLFTDPMIRAMARANGMKISPFEATVGLIWTCMSRAKGMRDELMGMSLCLDVRMTLNVNENFFGNCMVYHKLQNTKRSSVTTTGDILSHAIEEIRRTTKEIDYDSVMDLIEWLRIKDHIDPIRNGSDMVCTNLENLMDLGHTRFEEEMTLKHVSCYVEGPAVGGGRVTVLPPLSTGEGPMSRVAMITLPRTLIAKVLSDELLQTFHPIVLMGPKCQIK
ncbi:PREDICTED: protein ECERIFERUM 26-like [Tarenaya hassleriana]|uniref:protein ECERIFERUM 26-like n=1 Tax=Tarenaya hassleriana TaxID=28532 RepID=UPI00053C5635|nr:PREDICTED: protein ECERIFERUM 26-like [Tarenaya hassleriana]